MRLAPWFAILLIAVLSLTPSEWRPYAAHSILTERFVTYFLAALILAIRFPRPAAGIEIAAWLSIYAGSLEIIQLLIPGHFGRYGDFVMSSLGALCGVAFGLLATIWWEHWHVPTAEGASDHFETPGGSAEDIAHTRL
jgi:VanZ family protein